MELNPQGKNPYRWAAPHSSRRNVASKASSTLTTSRTTATTTSTSLTTTMSSQITHKPIVSPPQVQEQAIADLNQGLQKMHLSSQTPSSSASAPPSMATSTCTTSCKSSISASSSNGCSGKPLATPSMAVNSQETENLSFPVASAAPPRLHESSSEMVSERSGVSLASEGHPHVRSAPRPGKNAFDGHKSKARNQTRKQSYSSRREGFSEPRQRVVHQDGLFPNPVPCTLSYFAQAPPFSFEHFPPLSRQRPQEFMWDGAEDRMTRGQQNGVGDPHRRERCESFQGNGTQNKNGMYGSGRFSEGSHQTDSVWRFRNGQRQRQAGNLDISFPDHSCGHDRTGAKKVPASYYANMRDGQTRDNSKRRKNEYKNMNEQGSRYDRYNGFCAKANHGYQDSMREGPWYNTTIDVSRPPPASSEQFQGMWAHVNGNGARLDFEARQRDRMYPPMMGNGEMPIGFKTPANYKRLVPKTSRARSVENVPRNMSAFDPQRHSEMTKGTMPVYDDPPVSKVRHGRRNSGGAFGGRRSRSFERSLDGDGYSMNTAQAPLSVWPSDHNKVGKYYNIGLRERHTHMPTKANRHHHMESSSASSVTSASSHSGGEELNGRRWGRQNRASRGLTFSSSESFSEEIKEEMARAQKMDIPVNVSSKRRRDHKCKDLNPQATEFNPTLTDSRGVAYVMTNANGVTYFNPKTDPQKPNPNYVIDTRGPSEQEYTEENTVNHSYGIPLNETYTSDQPLQIVPVGNSGGPDLQMMQNSEENYTTAHGDLTCLRAQSTSQIVQVQSQPSAFVPAYVEHGNSALTPSQDIYTHSVLPPTPAAVPSPTILMQVPGPQMSVNSMCAGFQQVTYPPQTGMGFPASAPVVNSSQFTFSAADQEHAATAQENCPAQFAFNLPSPFSMLPQPGQTFVDPSTETSVISPFACFPAAPPLQAPQTVTVLHATPVYNAMTQPATPTQHAPPIFSLQAHCTNVQAGELDGASEAPFLVGAHEVFNAQAEAGACAGACSTLTLDEAETSSTESSKGGGLQQTMQRMQEYVRHSILTQKPQIGEYEMNREIRKVITKLVHRVRWTELQSAVRLSDEQLVEMVLKGIGDTTRSASEIPTEMTVSETVPAEEVQTDGQNPAQPSPGLATASAEFPPNHPTLGPLVESNPRSLGGAKARDGHDDVKRLPSSSGAQEVCGPSSAHRETNSNNSGARDFSCEPPTSKPIASLKEDDLRENRRDSLENVCVEERISYFECNKAEGGNNRLR